MQSHKKNDTSTAPDKIPLETKVSEESSSGKTLLDSEKAPISSPPLRRSRRTQSSPKQAITTPKILSDNLAKALIANSEEFEVGTVVEERDISKSMDPLENDPTTVDEHCPPSEQTHDEGITNQETQTHDCGKTEEVQDDSWPLSEKPYFHTVLTKSNLRSSFLLMIPTKMYHILPEKEVPVVLTCRNMTWTMSYYGDRGTNRRFDSRWRNFAMDNNLRIGDGCVFELLECSEEIVKFRVRILNGDIPAVFLDRIDGKSPNNPILINDGLEQLGMGRVASKNINSKERSEGNANREKELKEVREMTLPNFFALYEPTSNFSKYVRYINEDVPERGFLSFSGSNVVSPFTKFEMVAAESGEELVHIRCTYNNKYWVKSSEDDDKIIAGAIEPEEDQSKWSCTLFEPVFGEYDGLQTVQFRHANLNYYVYLLLDAPPQESWLYIGEETPDTSYWDKFSVTDLDSLMIMPKYVAFKGDDDNYLGTSMIGNQPFIKFAVDDINDPTVVFEVFTTHNGSIYLKSVQANGFWRYNSDWVLVEVVDSANLTSSRDYDSLFWPTKVEKIVWPPKVEKNDVVLRNVSNGLFCRRVLDFSNRLSPIDPTDVSLLAQLEMEEPVTSRRIYGFKYFLPDGWIYNKTIIEIDTEEVENRTEHPITEDVKFCYTDTKSNCWNSSASLKLRSVPTILETDAPFIEEGNIEISSEIAGSFAYKWGETIASETAMESVCTVTVPPMTTVKVKLTATQASYDVHFSYSQLDILINGDEIPYNMEDGVYTGTYCFNHQCETEEEEIL